MATGFAEVTVTGALQTRLSEDGSCAITDPLPGVLPEEKVAPVIVGSGSGVIVPIVEDHAMLAGHSTTLLPLS